MLARFKRVYQWAERVEFPISLFISILPAGTGAAVLGWLDGYDYSIQWAVFCFSWAALSFGAKQCQDLYFEFEKRSPKHKLITGTVFKIYRDNKDKISIRPGIKLTNNHSAPLWYEVKYFHAVIGGNSVTLPENPNKRGVVEAGKFDEYFFAVIPEVASFGEKAEGRLSFEIKFGVKESGLKNGREAELLFECLPYSDEYGKPNGDHHTHQVVLKDNRY